MLCYPMTLPKPARSAKNEQHHFERHGDDATRRVYVAILALDAVACALRRLLAPSAERSASLRQPSARFGRAITSVRSPSRTPSPAGR